MKRNLSFFSKTGKAYNYILKNAFITLLLLITTAATAQNNIELSGQVKDKESGDNLMYCTVSVFNSSDSLITGGITNEKGYFNIPVNPGKYKIVFSYTGYIPDTIVTGVVIDNRFLGIFKLKKDLQSLDEVEITASSRESSIDKDVQIVTDELRKGAADTKDVLEKIPGLSYDRYNNTISVDNSSNVIFLVEGIEKNQEYIKNLSPERLKKVEIIRNPGGKYGLEGYSAVINIILRKDYRGQEFFITDQALLDPDQKNKSYLLPINRVNATYNYSFNKFNIYAGINNHFEKFALNTSNETNYEGGTQVIEKSTDDYPNMFFHNVSTSYTLGADYYINPRNTVSFESNIASFPTPKQEINQTMQTNIYNNNVLVDSFIYNTSLNNKTNSSYNTLFYVGKLTAKDRIDANFTYQYYNEKYDNLTKYENQSDRNESGTNKKNYTKFNFEYTREFNNKLNTRFGYGNIWKRLDNNFKVTVSDYDQDTISVFKQTETRHNLYGYVSYSFNKKIALKTGLAVEFSNPVTEEQNNRYFIYQPYLDLKYNFSKKVSLKLMYRADSDYPTISQTNPFPSHLNPTTITVGNPNLKPSVTNMVSLKFSYMQGLFSIEPYYYFSNNYISQTGHLRPDGIFEYSYDNVGHYEDLGIQTNFTIRMGKLFVWQNSIKIYKSRITHNGYVNNVNDWNANSQLVFTGFKHNGILVMQYRRDMNKNITSMGYSRNSNDYWLFVARQPFFKNRLTIMVGYFLPVNWGVNYDQSSYTKAEDYEKYTHTDISILKNMLIFRVTFRFNKGKVKKLDKNIETEEENRGGGIF